MGQESVWGSFSFSVPALVLLAVPGCDDGCIPFPCDDDDPCTVDTCLGIDFDPPCSHSPVDCGDQVCNPDDGACVECVGDAGCADDTFCNGVETCVNNACVEGENPCAEVDLCDEAGDECVAE